MDKHAGNIAAAAAFAAVLIVGLTAQEPGFRGRELQPPKPSTAYTVGGIRHGISYFPMAGYDFTKPKAAGVMDFSHYHTYDEVTAFLRQVGRGLPEPRRALLRRQDLRRSRHLADHDHQQGHRQGHGQAGHVHRRATGIRARSRRPSPPSGSPGTS